MLFPLALCICLCLLLPLTNQHRWISEDALLLSYDLSEHLSACTRFTSEISLDTLKAMRGDKHARLVPSNTLRAHHPSSIVLQSAIFIPSSVLTWYEYDRQRTDRNTRVIIQHNIINFIHVIINIIIINIIMIIINGFCRSEGDVMRRLYGDEGKWGHLLLLYPLVHLISELNYWREINMTVEPSYTRSPHTLPLSILFFLALRSTERDCVHYTVWIRTTLLLTQSTQKNTL